jgi:hypothetical protein
MLIAQHQKSVAVETAKLQDISGSLGATCAELRKGFLPRCQE